MRKEIEKLDEEFYDNIEVIGVNGCLHRRDAKLLELVRGEIVKPFTDEEYYSYEYAIVKIISVIDGIKEAINGKG